jgi:putative transposase/transposase-like zinc-binding protein
MSRPALEVGDIFRQHGPAYRSAHHGSLSYQQLRVMRWIEVCRTSALGGHVEQCDQCGHVRISYCSCRNRHCPKCQTLAKEQWLRDRQAELLPVEYFHVVFSVPAQIAALAYQNKAVVYGILFRSVSETLRQIAADPKRLGAEIGFIAVLHTWGQTLEHHPHIHCVVPGGGIATDGERWISCRRGFFLPVRVLSRRFRRLFLRHLDEAFQAGKLQFFSELKEFSDAAAWRHYLRAQRGREWVVYAKRPFGGPQQVLDYLGRYTHRVAISNHRLLELDDGKVSFQWKDYRDQSRQKVMTLEADEFIRRFLLHVLPKGFQRIRQYGFLAGRCRAVKLTRCRELLDVPIPDEAPGAVKGWRERYEAITGESLDCCPACRRGRMVPVSILAPGQEWQAPVAAINSS